MKHIIILLKLLVVVNRSTLIGLILLNITPIVFVVAIASLNASVTTSTGTLFLYLFSLMCIVMIVNTITSKSFKNYIKYIRKYHEK